MKPACLIVPAVLLATAVAAADGPKYTITPLAPLAIDGSGFADADSINAAGQVGGRSTVVGGEIRPTLWLQSPAYGLPTGPNDLGDLGSGGGRIYGLNDLGQGVGFVAPPAGDPGYARACRWDPDGGMVDLGLLGGDHSIAHAINNSGWVVGETKTDDPSQYRHAFIHDGSTMIDLGTFGGILSRAYDINESGQVIGVASYIDGDPWNSRIHAFLWLPEPAYGLPAGLHDIDDYSAVLQQTSRGSGLNDAGQIVGWLTWINEFGQSVTQFGMWLPDPAYGLPAGWTDLRGPGYERVTAYAHDINNRGEVVLRAEEDPHDWLFGLQAFLWRQGQWFNLNDCLSPQDQQVWWLGSATDINDSGQITGWGRYNGADWAFLLTPIIDEPACLGDTNGDQIVDVDDLTNVILDWGLADSTADLNGDQIVDVDDLTLVIVGWGPCDGDPMGVCCFAVTGDCQTTTLGDCQFMGGTWHAGATCQTFTCPELPSGACCFYPSGECSQATDLDCMIAGGAWQGAGTDCASAQCPLPPPGDRIEDPFPVPGIPYAVTGSTIGFGDDYDAVCPFSGSEAPDVVYALTPAQDVDLTISLCAGTDYDSKLYVYEGDVSLVAACNDDFCTSPAFPDPYVSRIDLVSLSAGTSYYIVVDGYGLEAGTYTLDIELAASGACCLPDGDCQLTTEVGCPLFGGTWQGTGTDCATTVCPPEVIGACCWGAGGCVETNDYVCNIVYGGTWQGPETTCAGANCP